MPKKTAEHTRLEENRGTVPPWRKWGPYLAERAWATVREDYSDTGDAWSYFPFDLAHKKVYRWGDDGIAGWCDRYQILIFAPAFWNGKDPLLKERLFGLSSPQGNHGEDVKECYYHLDALPSHAYMKYLYKYPQEAFPYQKLIEENGKRGPEAEEYELIDTGIFENNRYFDIQIEYGKRSVEDLCIKITATNRGDRAAPLHIFPHLWFRNQHAWGETPLPKPSIRPFRSKAGVCIEADEQQMPPPKNLIFEYRLGRRYLYGPKEGRPLFTNNENEHIEPIHNKEAFHREIAGQQKRKKVCKEGTKACIHYEYPSIGPGESIVLRLRFSDQVLAAPLDEVDSIIAARKKEADEFYETIHAPKASAEEKSIQRQALAGMLWTKQIYLFDVNRWLEGDNPKCPPPKNRENIRNKHWRHLNSMRVLSMPDKWEYPWFAAWDLAFHCLALSLVDIEFAKEQLWILLFDQFQHPNGEIPAYEWEFSDLNPPLQAWVALQLFTREKEQTGKADLPYLKKCFFKLLINFSWWVNRVDSEGWNVFEGGFLGLDNIALIDRSSDDLSGAVLKQSDGTGWMGMFALNMMRISLILADDTQSYELLAVKFFEHFIYIAHAMKKRGHQNYKLWDDHDGFFYDVLCYPNANFEQFKVRSLVGIIPLYAVDVLRKDEIDQHPEFRAHMQWFMQNRADLVQDCVTTCKEGFLLSLVTPEQLAKVLHYIVDPKEFRSDYGLRSLSKHHLKHPIHYKDRVIQYEPGTSVNKIKGGNSNWRGPIWMPTHFLFVKSLQHFAAALGNGVQVKGERGKLLTIDQIAADFAERAISLFKTGKNGLRPIYGNTLMGVDPHFKEHILFYEYFNGDNGLGLGASHQTGWTGLVANLIDEYRSGG